MARTPVSVISLRYAAECVHYCFGWLICICAHVFLPDFDGLAQFHELTQPLWWFVQVHILGECALLFFGVVAFVSVNYDLCSAVLSRTMLSYVGIQSAVLLVRISHHMLFPAYVRRYNLENPIPEQSPPVRRA